MSKKSGFLFTMFTTLLLVAMFGGISVSAADMTVSSDRTLTAKFNKYDNVVVKNGATLTLARRAGEPVGLEIGKSLVVKEGSSVTGEGILIFHKGATFSGITLYYKFRGNIYPIPEVMQLDVLTSNTSDYQPTFVFDTKGKVFVLDATFQGGNPFELDLSDRNITLYKNKTHRLTLSGLAKGIEWSSSDESVATVSKTGQVTAKAIGRAVITAKYAETEYYCEVNVVKKGLSCKKLYLNNGDEFYLQLNGTKVKAVSSSNKKVAKITKGLKIIATGEGKCSVTVTGTNGKKYKCSICVMPFPEEEAVPEETRQPQAAD